MTSFRCLLFALVLGMMKLSSQNSRVARVVGPQRKQGGAFCIPDGWQSGRAVTVATTKNFSKPSVTRNMGDIIYSSSQKKMLIDDFVYAEKGKRLMRIFDYPEKILYTVHGHEGEQNQTCVKTPLTAPFTPLCVPENATMTKYKSYYGTPQPYIEYFIEFAGNISHKNSNVNYRVSLTRDHTTPLFEQLWGQREGERFFQTVEYFNSTIWGNMPSTIFTPPKVCNKVFVTEMPARTSIRQEMALILLLQ